MQGSLLAGSRGLEDVLPPMFGWHVPWDSPLPYVGLEFVKTATRFNRKPGGTCCPQSYPSPTLKQEDHGAEFDKALPSNHCMRTRGLSPHHSLTLEAPKESNHSHMPPEAKSC